jgi:hypothetical protein
MKVITIFALAILVLWTASHRARQPQVAAQASPYAAMAPLDQYLIPDKQAEIALARTAAPTSISGEADVMVLQRDGYATAVKGSNGFLCLVERSWGSPTDDPDFWNPKIRSPICFNPAAAKTFAPIFLMKTRLAIAGKQKSEIAQAIASAFENRELPALEPGAMCYMMSKQQYLNDRDKGWKPHLMFFVVGSVAKSWGANLPGSPIIAADDPEERATIFMIPVDQWSDDSPATRVAY